VDIHVEVDPEITVREGHAIAHAVKDRIVRSMVLIKDVLVHIEPAPAAASRGRQPPEEATSTVASRGRQLPEGATATPASRGRQPPEEATGPSAGG
jgi:hypothetical protein